MSKFWKPGESFPNSDSLISTNIKLESKNSVNLENNIKKHENPLLSRSVLSMKVFTNKFSYTICLILYMLTACYLFISL